ncbi:MAG: hypothetical protein DRI84_01795 [Bacteroidetes bacterium]|nr:MAG: hypothetical protein DRI84_01795 [Bacteroidota bacterium]
MQIKKIHIIPILFALSMQLNAQINLVPNYSFEQYDICPYSISSVTPSCTNWFTPISKMQIIPPPPYSTNNWGSSDYFNTCSTIPTLRPPNNSAGFQYPLTGNAYNGIVLNMSNQSLDICFKEYIEAKLISKLISGRHCIEFYYSTSGYFDNNEYHSIEIGALLTDTLVYRLSGINTQQPQNIYANPQVKQQLPLIRDTLNWIKVSGSFIAKGGEQYLTIGSFQYTDTLKDKSIYIYIDNVKLWNCDSGDTISPILPRELKVYPIPSLNNKITVDYVNGSLGGMQFYLYNTLGQKVYQHKFISGISKKELSLIHLASGVYYYSLGSSEAVYEKGKIILLE